MMIPQPVVDKLNQQIANEFGAAHTYLAMACRFDELGLKMLSQFFFRQSDEEREHGRKILDYVLEVGADVKLQATPEPTGDMSTAVSIVSTALEQEKEVTRQINDIAATAEAEKDFATRSFINWFIDEQVEEVSSMTELLELVKLAGDDHMLQVEMRVAKMMAAPHPS
ncbi:MAG: ferritin [Phycisphaerae bacterium]|nr:MAG: ferritin [Phycisphaerae bacterium]